MAMQIYLIRHGKTKANLEHRYLGRTDEELCEEGCFELREKSVSMPQIDYLFASPMLRCKQTCQILFPNHSYHVMDGFQEMDFGDFERKNYDELKDEPAYQKWLASNGTIAFPNGESREQFIKRNMDGFYSMCNQIKKNIEDDTEQIRVAAVVHGGSIMAILSTLTNGEYFDFQCGNGAGYSFSMDRGEIKDISEIWVRKEGCV